LNLDPDKKERILIAAYKEFADKGYKNASTNTIVKEADISKGMLFYYFESKKQLFMDLVRQAGDFIDEDLLRHIDYAIPDFFDRLIHISTLKFQSFYKKPYIYEFMGGLHLVLMKEDKKELPREFYEYMQKQSGKNEILSKKLYENVDTSKFRKSPPAEELMKIIQYSLIGYEKALMEYFSNEGISKVNMDEVWADYFGFMDALKEVLYR